MPPSREDCFAYLTTALKDKTADDPLVLDLVSQLNRDAQPMHAAVFHAGFSRGQEKGEKKSGDRVTDLEGQLTEAKAALGTATTKIAELERASPNLAAVRSEYETKLREREEHWTREHAKLTGTLGTERKGRRRAEFLAQAKEAGLRDVYAENMWDRADFGGRVNFGEDGRLEIHEPTRKIPFIVTAADRDQHDTAMLKLFVDEIRKGAPADMVLSTADRGAGTGGDRGAGGGDAVGTFAKAAQAARDARPNPLVSGLNAGHGVPALPGPAAPAATPGR